MKTKRNTKKGFTFVETLVAISVLLIALVAPLTLGSQGLTASRVARDQVIATYLIQEAVEYVRARRDTNRLQGLDWLSGITFCITEDEGEDSCTVDVPQNTVEKCDIFCDPIRYNTTTFLYGYNSSWSQTKFTRTVSLQEVINNQEIIVLVTVSWKDNTITRTLSIEERLLNWQ